MLVQIWDPAFTRPYSSRAIDPLPRLNAEGFATLDHEGRSWRVYATPSGKQAIQVAQPTALRAELAARSAGRLLLPVVIVLPFLGLLGWWIVGRGLHPYRSGKDIVAARPDFAAAGNGCRVADRSAAAGRIAECAPATA